MKPISDTILREEAINYTQELQVEEFRDSNGWSDRQEARLNVSFKAIAGEKKRSNT